MPPTSPEFGVSDIHETIDNLIQNLIKIKDESGVFLQKLDDGRVIDTKSWNGWDWTHGIGLYGLWNYHILTKSPTILDIINDWFTKHLPLGTTKNINTMAVFLTLAYLYEETKENTYLPHLKEWANWAMVELPRTPYEGMQHITYERLNDNELWDDTLMMTVMPLAKIGKLFGSEKYVEEAKRQFLTHIQFLFDTQTGLWFHGWKFEAERPGMLGHNFARALWARGNSWVTIAIPELLELLNLSSQDPFRQHLISVLEMQCTALKRLQESDGMWRTLLDVSKDDGSYVEASATAGFAYGMLKAIRLGYISREYEDVAIRAVGAVLNRISPDGELQDVSFGTAMGHDLQHYLDIPRTSMPYGQAMAIMALGEFLQTLQ